VRFQINPHYTDRTISNHGGETRAERIAEFLEVNSEKTVAGLPEGTLLEIDGDHLALKGDGVLRIFRKGMAVKEAHPGDSLDWLLKS
jgi:dipeptidase E